MTIQNPQSKNIKIGHYIVGNNVFKNKVDALVNCKTDVDPKWVFLNENLSKANWMVEPENDLYELYKKRAIQLRAKYDYLVLMFSGGIDSYSVLRTFVDNGIPIDAIVSYGSFESNGWQNLTRNAEVVKVALPLIQKLKNKNGTKIKHHMLNDWQYFSRFKDESWIFSTGNGQLSPEAYVFNFHWEDPLLQNFLSKGDTAIIRGVDKPRIIRENGEWKLVFLDSVTFGSFPAGVDTKTNHLYGTEYFYWQDQLPELLIKQAHCVRNGFLQAIKNSKQKKQSYWNDLLTLDSDKFDQKEYTKWVDPFIYGRYVNQKPGDERNYFTLGKSPCCMSWIRDHAFFDHGEKCAIDVWKKGLQYCVDRIDHKFLNTDPNLTRDENLLLFKKKGFRGLISEKHTFAID